MIDLVYVIATVSFFCLMVLYVGACDRLGREPEAERASTEQP